MHLVTLYSLNSRARFVVTRIRVKLLARVSKRCQRHTMHDTHKWHWSVHVGSLRLALFAHPDCVASAINVGNTDKSWVSIVLYYTNVYDHAKLSIASFDVALLARLFFSVEFSSRVIHGYSLFVKKRGISVVVIHSSSSC